MGPLPPDLREAVELGVMLGMSVAAGAAHSSERLTRLQVAALLELLGTPDFCRKLVALWERHARAGTPPTPEQFRRLVATIIADVERAIAERKPS